MAEDAENYTNSAMGYVGERGRGGDRKQMQPASLIASVRGGCGGGRGRSESKYVLALNATCMHVDVSLSHISVLLLQPLSI